MSQNNAVQYTEDNIKTLEPREHVRLRPGMYIGKLGDGSSADDGIYILLKEVVDNSIDEFRMKSGKKIEVKIKDGKVVVRDYGRGIPLGRIVDVVSKMNTGGKYDDGAFKKSIGLNGVGTKAVNFLSKYFQVKSVREGKMRRAEFAEGKLLQLFEEEDTTERNGTEITFIPDETIFVNYKFRTEYVERMLRNYTYLNLGLKIYYNGEVFESQNGLKDLLEEEIDGEIVYPIIHIKDEDLEIAITHSDKSQSETYFSFVNGQYTSQGGTHLNAFKEAYVKTIREFFNKQFDASDIRKAIIGAVYINVGNPVFESQTKTKLGSTTMGQDKDGNELETIKTFVINSLKSKLDNYLHKNPETAEAIHKKILVSERERKELSGIQKLARERAKKVSLHNKKLRDCRQHYNDQKAVRKGETMIFI
ncbi:MAG: ATP-binding protein, partial [Bergeyella zoohelcum]|nr:ATP-binding protein [Bergeyella zoohelcum]